VSEESRAALFPGLGLGPSWSVFGPAFVGAGARSSRVRTAQCEGNERRQPDGRNAAKPCPTFAPPRCATRTGNACGSE